MRFLIFLTGAALMAQTTLTTIQSTDQVSASRDAINANFAALLAKHLQGFGSPIGSVPCSISQNRGAIYTRLDASTTNASAFVCANTGSGTYTWELIAGGGGGGGGNMIGSNNLSEITSAATARTNLGLGTIATFASTAFEPAITAGTTAQFLRGDKTWQTLSTSAVPEGAALYHTSARVWSAMGGTTNGSVPVGNGSSFTMVAMPGCTTSQKTNYRGGAFVCDADLDSGGAGGVGTSTNGQLLANGSGSVVGLDTIGSGAVARVASATMSDLSLSGVSTAPTAAPGTATTQIASTAFVAAMGALKANLASPTFSGTPTAPTQTAGDNSTKLATTAYADAIAALKANIASPAFTGDPTVPTASASDNDTSAASTAHVKSAIAAAIVAPGTANQVAAMNGAGSAPVYKTWTAGSGITISHTDSAVTIAASGGGGKVYEWYIDVPSFTFDTPHNEVKYVSTACTIARVIGHSHTYGGGFGALYLQQGANPAGTYTQPTWGALSGTGIFAGDKFSETITTFTGWTGSGVIAANTALRINYSGTSGSGVRATIRIECQ